MAKLDPNTLSLGLSFGDEPARGAVVSADGVYRTTLTRLWDVTKPTAHWICLNPSTADSEVDDPTSGRIMSFSRALGCGRYVLENLFSYRATSPTRLKKQYDSVHAAVMAGASTNEEKLLAGVVAKARATAHIVGPDNEAALNAMFRTASEREEVVIAGWGAAPILQHVPAHEAAFALADRWGIRIKCLGTTEKAPVQPRHPLYVPGSTALTDL